MSENVLLAILSLIGTMLGTLGGIFVSSKLTNYRIEQLEKKVDKHNGFGEKIPVIQEQIKVINHRIGDLEKHKADKEFGGAYLPTIEMLIAKGYLKGKGGSGDELILDLSEDSVRILVILDRAGNFD